MHIYLHFLWVNTIMGQLGHLVSVQLNDPGKCTVSDVGWLESVGKLLIPPSPSPHLGNHKSVLCVCFCFMHVLSRFSPIHLFVTPWIVAPPESSVHRIL